MSDIRKYFTMNTSTRDYNFLDEKGRALVDAGFKVAKQYYVNRSKKSEKKDAYQLLALDGGVDNYSELNQKFVSKLVKYSMEKAGMETAAFTNEDGSFNPACVANPMVNKNSVFRDTFNAVIAQILTPIVPAMISADFMDMADVANIAYGDTARFIVHSNDTFYVTNQAEGILRGSIQRLYNDEITVNPSAYNIETAVDWYQVAAGVYDFGEFVYKVGVSYNGYITQMIIMALTEYIDAGVDASSPYFVDGYTDAKFAALTERVRAANGGSHVTAWGALTALAAILPDTARVNMYADIGAEWARVGHLTTYMDVDIYRIPQLILPNTVNTTALFGVPADTVYIFADGGYRPVKLVFEGQAVTIDIIPTEAPDKQMGISVTMKMGMGFTAASKFGAITGVTLA